MKAPRTIAAHTALMDDVLAMNALEAGRGSQKGPLPNTFTVAAWNVERCLFPEASAVHLQPFAPSLVLLSEMDSGMARTAQRNTTADMAAALGMHYAYGVEFYEMDLGGETERAYCQDDFNAEGWHGNAILSAAPFEDLRLIRLDQHGHWFCSDAVDPGQPRIGGRMAVAGIIATDAGPICAVSTHLESNAGAAHRHAEFSHLLSAIEDFAPDMPVIIGGDLNTGNHIPPNFDWRDETLFQLAKDRGYHWDLTAPGTTTRPSLITPHPTRVMKLDWFCARGMTGTPVQTLSSVDVTGRPLSDHDCMLCSVDLSKTV
ncbi:MAG: endonuclease [Paracoccaceae bacterium]